MKLLPFQVFKKQIQSTKTMLFSWDQMHQNLTLDITLTLWSGFQFLKQIHNYAICTDFYNPINKISVQNVFSVL